MGQKHESGLVCIHRCGCGGLCDSGVPCPMADNSPDLCERCQAEYDADPVAFFEFGFHETGINNWNELRRELDRATEAAQDATPPEAWNEIPF